MDKIRKHGLTFMYANCEWNTFRPMQFLNFNCTMSRIGYQQNAGKYGIANVLDQCTIELPELKLSDSNELGA